MSSAQPSGALDRMLPSSLKVKNTFIDVKTNFVREYSGDGGDLPLLNDPRQFGTRRQVSEPPPTMTRLVTASQFGDQLLEDPEESTDEGPEPETEVEPRNPRRQNRQDTELSWMNTPLGRQVTEQNWPSWGHPMGGDAASSLAQANVQEQLCSLQAATALTAANLWMYQYANFAPQDSDPVADQGQIPDPAAGNLTEATAAALAQVLAAAANSGPWPPVAPASNTRQAHSLSQAVGLPQVMAPPGGRCNSLPTAEWTNITTIMMRNLPNKYTQHMLLEELNAAGFLATFDFVYLPIDPETCANRGYAFINFTDPSYAWMLKVGYEGQKMARFNSDKVVSVAPAALQGFEANYAHYSTARVNRGDPSARPLFLRESCVPRNGNARQVQGRRRGGRRSQGSLIDLATKQQAGHQPSRMNDGAQMQQMPQSQQQQQQMLIAKPEQNLVGTYIGLGTGGNNRRKDASVPAPVQQVTPRFCPFCGGECQPQFKFCQFCGASLNLATGKGPPTA